MLSLVARSFTTPFRGSFHRESPPAPGNFQRAPSEASERPWEHVLGQHYHRRSIVRCSHVLFASLEPEACLEIQKKRVYVLGLLYVLYELGHTPCSALNTAGLWNRLF
jgi:hypothetical protein